MGSSTDKEYSLMEKIGLKQGLKKFLVLECENIILGVFKRKYIYSLFWKDYLEKKKKNLGKCVIKR